VKLFVLEYITGGGFKNEPIPEFLSREGDLMLIALLNDLAQINDLEVLVFRDSRLQPLPDFHNEHGIEVLSVHPHDDFQELWKTALSQCDAVWPIAPESRGILSELSAAVESAGCILLNSSSISVGVTTSKHQTAKRCGRHGIAHVPTVMLEEFVDDFPGPWVIKPDDGVACEGSKIIRTRDALDIARRSCEKGSLIVQPFTPGIAESLSILFDGQSSRLLSINRQEIKIDRNCFILLACSVNAVDSGLSQYQELVDNIARSFPGLWGYVGVDLITEEGIPSVLEINPRLTTSYVGLNAALGINAAAMVLNMIDSPLKFDGGTAYNGKSFTVELENSHGS